MNDHKTWLEIYQPVIVGLGAVVLGLFANGCLEWWRNHLSSRESVLNIRKALLFDVIDIELVARNAKNYFENAKKDGFLPIKVPSSILSFDREKIGRLSLEEVRALAKLMGFLTATVSVGKVHSDTSSYGDSIGIPFEAGAEHDRSFITQLHESAIGARAALEKCLDKKR